MVRLLRQDRPAPAARDPDPRARCVRTRARRPRRAVDLGCGGGRDIAEMLRRGWAVLAIDAEATAIERLAARDDLPSTGRLETRIGRFEEIDWPACRAGEFQLRPAALPALGVSRAVVADRRLPRSRRPLRGPALRRPGRVVRRPFDHLSLSPGGRCAARGFEVEHLREEEDDSITPRGRPKHWHIFHIVARKKG